MEVSAVITSFVGILVGVVLAPIIYSTATNANVSGTTATVIALIPTFFALGVLVLSIKSML